MDQNKDDFWDEFIRDLHLDDDQPPAAEPPAPEPEPAPPEPTPLAEFDLEKAEILETPAPAPAPQPAPEPAFAPAPAPAEEKPEKPVKQPKPYKYKPKKKKKVEVDFDYEHEYADVEEKFVRRGQGKRTGCLGGVLYFLFVACISTLLACVLWMAAVDVLALGKEPGEVTVTVPRDIFSSVEKTVENEDGTTTTKTVTTADMDWVADMLFDNELIQYKELFKLFSVFAKGSEKIKAGTYILNRDYDYRALISGMNPNGGERVTTDVTIPEGYTVAQIVEYLDEKGICDKNELWDAVTNHEFDYDFLDPDTLGDPYRLEGYLFPDTYTFYLGDTPDRVVRKFLSNFKNRWTAEMSEAAQELGYTQREILTIASLIEKEAGADSERKTIASVIYNRLENVNAAAGTNGYLQIDAAVYYAVSRTGEAFNLEVDSPYNTYRYPGLPAGPIANPGLASIKAALDPESTNYYYYALGKDRTHRFFSTLDAQLAFIHSDEYGG